MTERTRAEVWLVGSAGKGIDEVAVHLCNEGYSVQLHPLEHWPETGPGRSAPDVIVLVAETVAQAGEWRRRLPVRAGAPTLVVAGRDARDREEALRAGFTDCLSLPFSVSELGLRVQSLVRSLGLGPRARGVSWSGYTLDRSLRQVHRPAGDAIALTETESCIFGALLEAAGAAAERCRLARAARVLPSGRSLDVHIANIRAKFRRAGEHKLRILAVRHTGYQVVAEQAPAWGRGRRPTAGAGAEPRRVAPFRETAVST